MSHWQIRIRDDGIGLAPSARSCGPANMRRRAQRHGGTFEIGPGEPTGTVVTWSIPTR